MPFFVSVELQQLVKPVSGDVMYAVGFAGSSKLHAYGMNIKTGELLLRDSIDIPGGFSRDLSPVSSEIFVALDVQLTLLGIVRLNDGKLSFKEAEIHDLVPQIFERATVLPLKLVGMFAIRCSPYIVFVKVNDQSKLEVVDKIEDSAAVSDALSFTEEQQAFGIVQQGGGKTHLTVKPGDDYSTDLLKESIQIDQNEGLFRRFS